MLYKNLSLKKKRLYKLAYQLGLTDWDWAAAQILLNVNRYENAEGYLKKVAAKKGGSMKYILLFTIILFSSQVCAGEKAPVAAEKIVDLPFKTPEIAPEGFVKGEPIPEVAKPLITIKSLNARVLTLNSQFNRIVKQLESLERAREQIRGQVILLDELRKELLGANKGEE